MRILSPSFPANGKIPERFTGEGEDISPALEWSDVPINTKEFVILCEDPDAPLSKERENPFVHWLIYKLSPATTFLPQGLPHKAMLDLPVPICQGTNSFGKPGYNGPMPPRGHGVHRYIFTVHAVDLEVRLPPGARREAVMQYIEGHIISSAQVIGTYERESLADQEKASA